ncbi:gamma-glutamylcyclotransferase family protein [uncultured Algimonas sp.]|uniref:gamma-glutamylcyclotransferase family protein n=1 Tax=uncultured Algimonas sp. TaxID=1547920 RepID=UPI002618A035|nr:gamma-glutamylcyclotransferase family protein [uncultured Algimonas sp.]
MPRLFSYGTLRILRVQRDLFGRELVSEPDALVGYARTQVEITDPAVLALSGERFHPAVIRTGDPHDRVGGTVFTLSDAQLARADAYEVDEYERVAVTLASGRGAWLYVLAD